MPPGAARTPGYDAVVVGAGPTGSNTARLLALRGWKVLLLEEHPEVGHPVQCAGLVTPRTFDHTPFAVGDLLQNTLSGAIVFAPDGTSVAFDAGKPHAIAMDRARFDQRMAEHAVLAGVELRTGTKAVGAARDGQGITVRLRTALPVAQASPAAAIAAPPAPGAQPAARASSPDAAGGGTVGPAAQPTSAPRTSAPGVEVRTRLLVGADGIRSAVARWFGFPIVEEIVSAYEAELSGCSIPAGQEHMIPMFAGHAQAPGFFSWIIPVGGGRTRSGLAVAPGMNPESARAYYERMFTDPLSAPYLAGAKPSYLIIGGIPLGLREALVDDRVALVGDAAGMAKPTSGGGIYYGLLASECLATHADRALRADRLSRGDLLGYEKDVRRILGRELSKGWALRRLYKRLSDDDFNRLARLLGTPRARRAIERWGDIDFPSRLVLPLAWAQPRLVPFFLRVALRAQAPAAPGAGRKQLAHA